MNILRFLDMMTSFGRNRMVLIWKTLTFIKTKLNVTHAIIPLIFYEKSFRTVLFLEEVIAAGPRDLVI